MTSQDPGDDFLYDRSGPPDAEVERLERLMRPLGTHDHAPARAAMSSAPRRGRLLLLGALAVAAAAGIVALTVAGPGPAEPVLPPAPVATAPTVRDAAVGTDLATGAWVETGDAGREILVGDVGRVQIAARSRVQVRHVSGETTRLYLARGAIEARVSADARPRFFQVDTDAARCVDLGCRYTLEVAADGTATVRVVSGQVAFETPTREVFVPAGARAVARTGRGPGTPCFEDARAEVRDAFDAFDTAPAGRRVQLARAAIATVRDPRDTLPAWHLLQDADADVAAAAAARLEEVAGPCDVPSDGSDGDRRQAWKAYLFGKCW